MKRMVMKVNVYVNADTSDVAELEDRLGVLLWPDGSGDADRSLDIVWAEVITVREVER